MILTAQDRGRTVQLAAGESATLRLSENPTTGYRWTVLSNAGLELVRDTYEGGSGAVGAGSTRVLEFRAARTGSATLQLVNRQEWNPEGAADRFEVLVTVR